LFTENETVDGLDISYSKIVHLIPHKYGTKNSGSRIMMAK